MNESDETNWDVTSSNSTELLRNSSEVKLAPLIIVIVTCAVATSTNLLVLTILLCEHQIRKNYRIEFILWLCLSDLVLSIAGWLFVFNYVIKELTMNTHYCSLMYYLITVGIDQSLAHTFLICIDRYMAVVNHTRYQLFSKNYRYMVTFGTWVFIHGYVGTLVIIFMRADHISYCSLTAYPRHKAFVSAVAFLNLPLLISTPCLYISTMVMFKNRSKRTHNYPQVCVVDPSGNASQSCSIHVQERNTIRHIYEKQVIITTGLIVVNLLVLSGPLVMIIFLEGLEIIVISRSTRIFTCLMTLCNSAVNPFLYVCRIRKVRQVLRKAFCPCKPTDTSR
ncbi:olfactory receptor 11A1-like [Ylistrum balloti]|uniref:olfactory receptor 11A1-like n=1 Tax=Ylistrum balloti TaxID=509963 RepID=UPI002905EC55|nr:olfactory receptor 11A1-like [Ylistrum balloti]